MQTSSWRAKRLRVKSSMKPDSGSTRKRDCSASQSSSSSLADRRAPANRSNPMHRRALLQGKQRFVQACFSNPVNQVPEHEH